MPLNGFKEDRQNATLRSANFSQTHFYEHFCTLFIFWNKYVSEFLQKFENPLQWKFPSNLFQWTMHDNTIDRTIFFAITLIPHSLIHDILTTSSFYTLCKFHFLHFNFFYYPKMALLGSQQLYPLLKMLISCQQTYDIFFSILSKPSYITLHFFIKLVIFFTLFFLL